jgi:hypothetical protein
MRLRPNPLRKVLALGGAWDRIVFSAAIFFLFASLGLIVDAGSGGRHPLPLLVSNVLFSGLIALAYAWAAVRNPFLMLVPMGVHLVYTMWFVDVLPVGPDLEPAARAARLRFDSLGIAAAISLSYVCFLMFINRTGTRHVAAQTEIALARDIHRVLVPEVRTTLGAFEFFGRSIPSGDVGGDLVDVVDLGGGAWVAYVADVSGHGVSSGLLMGMVKSALRMRLRTGATAAELLTALDGVLEPLKHPAMFVTFAVVMRDRAGALTFTLAGHLPILRIRADGGIEPLSVSQLPVGMMPGTRFIDAPLPFEPGDTLALVTDGLVEVFDRQDREFGMERVEAAIVATGRAPLEDAAGALLHQVRAHGPQLDDQTWLFIRQS